MTLPEHIQPHPGPQSAFLDSTADIAIYGGQAGGGKSWALLAEAVRHCDNSGFTGVVFRRTQTQINNAGGLWDESTQMYSPMKANPRLRKEWNFDSGARISFHHLQHEKDKLTWQGTQFAMLGFDELTHFTETQFFYLLSRNRSTCGVKPYVRATTNPVPADDPIGGWVNRLISWWIDPKTGLAINERSGVIRWFIRYQGELVWGDSPEELIERYGRPDLPAHHAEQTVQPKSLTFIPAKLSDNPTLLRYDPSYRANLLALPEVEKQRLADGNWNAKVLAGLFFKVGMIEIVPALPASLYYCRAWDLAATDGAGDWTVGAKMGTDSEGIFYIADIQRGQWECSYRDRLMKQIAVLDEPCMIRLPQDPAAAGKSEARRLVMMLAGHDVRRATVTDTKTNRANGLASQMNAGNLKMLEGAWNHGLLQRLDTFPTKGVPDDEVDALADAFNELVLRRFPMVSMGSK